MTARDNPTTTRWRPSRWLLRAALTAAEAGMQVFPVQPHGKTPAVRQWEAGVDPTLVARWSAEVQRERAAALARLETTASVARRQRLSPDEIGQMVSGLGGMLKVLSRADVNDKAEVYRQLGVEIRYRHHDRTALVEARPSMYVVCVSEGGLGH